MKQLKVLIVSCTMNILGLITMHTYIWQLPNWHTFSWNEKDLLPLISSVRLKQGQLIEKINNLLDDDLKKAEAIVLEQEALKTARIEGETYNPESVRSSIHRQLGLSYAGLPKTERHIDGLVEVLLDAIANYKNRLNKKRLCLAGHSLSRKKNNQLILNKANL